MEVPCASPPWTGPERVVIAKMEILGEMCEIQKEGSELEHFLHGPEDANISIMSFAEIARG